MRAFSSSLTTRPFLPRGANWIPAHALITKTNQKLYDDLLTSAADAHMNMIRVWGGGVYEKEEFYDLCDEKGLLVWQDFMFACAQYPGTPAFLKLIKQEAEYQVRRISWRTCLALWCGNNEIEQAATSVSAKPKRKKAYEDVFYGVLPKVVARWDGVTPYWPSSPHNPEGYEKGHNNENGGDAHFWGVWHERKSVKSYEDKKFRFCSEFGMQSFSSPEVGGHLLSPGKVQHPRSGDGESPKEQRGKPDHPRLYFAALPFPKGLRLPGHAFPAQPRLLHEDWDRAFPAIDAADDGRALLAAQRLLAGCVVSSIEFGGHWKALHYEARRFFGPALVSVHVPGTETVGIGNYVTSTIHDVHIHTVFDGPQDAKAEIVWMLRHLDGRKLRTGRKPLALRYGESVRQLTLDFKKEMATYGARHLYFRVILRIGRETVSRQTVFLTAPRFLELPKGKPRVDVKKKSEKRFALRFSSSVFQYQIGFHLRKIAYRATDNFFDLDPGEVREIVVTTEKDLTVAAVKRALEAGSLVDTYE